MSDKGLLTVYAQKTPSGDVRIFRPDGSIMVTAWSPYQKSCPTHRNKFVTINCYRWKLVWKPGVTPADAHSESEDSKIIRQYGTPRKAPRVSRPRLTR